MRSTPPPGHLWLVMRPHFVHKRFLNLWFSSALDIQSSDIKAWDPDRNRLYSREWNRLLLARCVGALVMYE